MKLKLTWLLTLFMAFVMQFSFAQEKTVTGTVTTAADGLPLPGASVIVKGTTRGAQTDFDGKFTIQVSSGEILVVSYVGMNPTEITVGDSNTYNIELEDGNTLDEVVVVGYGTSTREALTGSVGEVKAKEIETVRNPNVVQGIVGKVAGVQVVNNSGQPGAAPTVRIRGIGSINASSAPLIVVNNVPFQGSLTSINPSDIATFTVLKDAAASALYGSRGSNGVIVITTKKGSKGKISANLDISVTHVSRGTPDYDIIQDPGRFYEAAFQTSRNTLIFNGETPTDASQIAAENLIIDNANLGYQLGYNAYSVADDQVIDPATGRLNPNATLLWDESWEDFMFDNNFSDKVFLSLAGGGENNKSYFSIGREKVNAFAIESSFERITSNFSIDMDLSENLKVGGLINYAHTVQNTPDQGGIAGAFSWTRSIAPIYPVFGYNLDGSPILDSNGVHIYDFGDGTGGTPRTRAYGSFANPYATSLEDVKEFTTDNVNGQVYASIDFLKDFNFRYNMSVDLRNTNNVSFDTGIGGDAGTVNGRSTPSSSRNFVFTNQQLLTWKKSFGDHNLDVLVGHESSQQQNVFLSASKTEFLLQDQTVLDQGITIQSITNNEFDYTVEGWLSRVNYNFDNKYFVTANFRRDASSVFSPENRWGNFYGFGAAWRLSQEKFLENVSWLNEFKLKTSFGQVGNDAILYPTGGRNYLAYLDQFTVSNSNGAIGLNLSFQGNRDLTWETSTTFNAGFELAMFDNRVSVDAEYFQREVEDLLFNTPQPPSSGLPSFPENIGDMINKGVEITINADVIRSDDFDLSVNLNATHYTNEVTSLPREFIDNGVFRLEEGRSQFDYFMREFAGVNPNNGAALFYTDVLDVNGDPTGQRVLTENYSEATEYFLDKSPIPDVYGGFGTSMRYKNWNLGINFAYQIGGYGRDNTYYGLFTAGPGENLHKDVFDRTWTVDNPNAELPVVISNNDQNFYGFSSMRLIDNSYLSLQDISLSYDFDGDLIDDLGLSALRLYATANNVYLWSHRQGYDPRLSLTGGNADSQFSLVRNVTFGVNVKF